MVSYRCPTSEEMKTNPPLSLLAKVRLTMVCALGSLALYANWPAAQDLPQYIAGIDIGRENRIEKVSVETFHSHKYPAWLCLASGPHYTTAITIQEPRSAHEGTYYPIAENTCFPNRLVFDFEKPPTKVYFDDADKDGFEDIIFEFAPAPRFKACVSYQHPKGQFSRPYSWDKYDLGPGRF